MTLTETPTQTVPTGTWKSDPTHSSVDFAVLHNGVTPFRGGFRDFEATLTDGELIGSAKVDGIVTEDENLTGHLLSPDFFDAERHPTLTFESGEILRDDDRAIVRGALTLKGVTLPVELRGTFVGPVADAYGATRLGLELETVINRTQFGINWNAPLPSGGNVLADDVKLVARLQLVQEA
jgi:polyisoprenoid-binding protein YceI